MNKTTHQRGRKVEQHTTKKLTVFYWVIGFVLVIGVIVIITYTTIGKTPPTATTGPGATNISLTPVSTIPDTALPLLSTYTSIPSGTTPEGFYYKGDPNAPITIVEYSDFECPACSYSATSTIPKLAKEYIQTGKARLVFHDFPLTQHTTAPLASAIARCAGEQGKFWEVHDAIFQKRDEWVQNPKPSTFVTIARQVGVDSMQLEACIQSNKYDQPITAARQASIQAGIDATPSYVVNGKKVDGNQLFTEIETILAAKGLR